MTTQSAIKYNSSSKEVLCQGDWDLAHLENIQSQFKIVSWPTSGNIIVDGAAITNMDSAGAWLLGTLLKKLTKKSLKIELQNFSEQHQKLLSIIEKQTALEKDIPQVKLPAWLARVGESTFNGLDETIKFLSFVGQLTTEWLRILIHPSRMRFSAVASVIEKTGYQALPIIALLSLMIGVVITYQMGVQLRNYGANIFIVDLLGLSVLREFGPLLTAIMVAGRSGSAFTAQLGIMNINQEIDALNTMGVTPGELLLLPRIIGIAIALPLLTVWADIFGVFGGMIMANNMLDVSWHEFLIRFRHNIPLRSLIIGVGKAPVFALIIGSIGCFEGMQVQGSADSVGQRTTRSVVLAIFFIIVADAIFSVLFSEFKL